MALRYEGFGLHITIIYIARKLGRCLINWRCARARERERRSSQLGPDPTLASFVREMCGQGQKGRGSVKSSQNR